jgi:radical SAM superfamily enzyme YgiQ (UPF0313 family)
VTRPVVLAHLDWQRPGDPRTGLGVASIAAQLGVSDVPTLLVSDAVNRADFDAEAWVDWVIDATVDAGPEAILGISAYVWSEPEVQHLLREACNRTAALIVVGGPQVSYVGPGQLEALYPGAHAFVRGQGELALAALALYDDSAGLGVHFSGQVDLGRRADAPLDGLASPYLDHDLPLGEAVRWETQRGCPFACSFCQHREPGSRLRNQRLAKDRLRAEAEAFAAAGVRRVSVLDPIFHVNSERATAILRMLKEVGLTARLSLQCRFELLTPDFLDALSDLDVELEFGLQTAVEAESAVIGRRNRMELVDARIQDLHEREIPFEVSLIYGLPLQTLDSFRYSVGWCLDRGVKTVRAWPLMLLRGTPLHAERSRWGYVESSGDRIPVVVASDTFSRNDHAAMARIAAELDTTTTRGGA